MRRFWILAALATTALGSGCARPSGEWILTQQNVVFGRNGAPVAVMVDVENETNEPQTIQSDQISGPGSGWYTLATKLPITVASGARVTLTVQLASTYPDIAWVTLQLRTTYGTPELSVTGQTPQFDGPDCGIAAQFDAGAPLGAAALGQTTVLEVPVAESADVGETILGATLEGPYAGDFTVESVFPMSVPEGVTVDVSLRFTPSYQGAEWVQLDLQTQAMGTSVIRVSALGTAPDAGE